MTMIEAEKYFKKYLGHGFHMFREEPEKYNEYRQLGISMKLEESWRQDIVKKIFENFFENQEHVWIQHSRIIDVLLESSTMIEENCSKLLSLMEQMNELDKKQKILVIENMVGNTKQMVVAI